MAALLRRVMLASCAGHAHGRHGPWPASRRTCFNRCDRLRPADLGRLMTQTFRHHHRWRRRRRLRAGEPAVGALGPFRAAARSRPGHAARRRARRRARYLSRLLLQRRLFLAGAEGALAARQQFAAHRLFAGPHHGRRLLGDGHGGAARHAGRLRRMGGSSARPAGAGTTCCRSSASSKTTSTSAATCTAPTARCRCGGTPKEQWPPLSKALESFAERAAVFPSSPT